MNIFNPTHSNSENISLEKTPSVGDNTATTKLTSAKPSRHTLAIFTPAVCHDSTTGVEQSSLLDNQGLSQVYGGLIGANTTPITGNNPSRMLAVVETCHPPCGVVKPTKLTGVFPMNTHTPHCTYNATPNTTTHAVPTCPPCNRQSTTMANIAQGYNPRTTTPATSVSIPIDVYHTDILDEIETIKVTLHNLAGAFSALYYGKLSEWQAKSIAGNALYSATDLHYLAECLLDKASEYLPNHLQGASHG